MKQRILQYLKEINENPVVFCWKKHEFEIQKVAEIDAV